ncbi:MAG: ATP-binding protein [Ghiorsea sp.]
MTSEEVSFHLHLNGDKEGLRALQGLAQQACDGTCLNDIQKNRIAVALDELFANIHEHGYANQGGEIECSACWFGEKGEAGHLQVTLRDFAKPLQDLSECKGVCPETLKDNPVPGGLGMHLICAITESFEHQPLDDGNQWCLVFDLAEKKEKQS